MTNRCRMHETYLKHDQPISKSLPNHSYPLSFYNEDWKVFNHVFNSTMPQGVKYQGDSTDSQVCSFPFDVFYQDLCLDLNLVYLCLNLGNLCLSFSTSASQLGASLSYLGASLSKLGRSFFTYRKAPTVPTSDNPTRLAQQAQMGGFSYGFVKKNYENHEKI